MTPDLPIHTLRGCDSKSPKATYPLIGQPPGLLNSSNVDLVCLQHEYGIFGGNAGSYVLELLQQPHNAGGYNAPYCSSSAGPRPANRHATDRLTLRSFIVMSEYSSRILQDVFGVPCEKIDLIPHGIPDLPFVEPDIYKESLSIGGKAVLLTFGLLSPNKGFESVIQALPRILSRHSNAVYVIAGATHPHVKAREGDRYRDQLQALARELGVEREVIFHNRFASPREMAALGWFGRYLHHAVLSRGTGCFGNPGLCPGRREGDHLDAVLARS